MEWYASRVEYDSDLVVRDPGELATLCVCYEKVYLPHTTEESSQWWFTAYGSDIHTIPGKLSLPINQDLTEDVNSWNKKNEVFFSEGILERLPPAEVHANVKLQATVLQSSELLVSLTNIPYWQLLAGDWRFFKQDMLLHLMRLLYEPRRAPQLFVSSTTRPARDLLVSLEIQAAFRYFLPRLSALPPEEVVELRDRVKDTREGFHLHLRQLSEAIDARLKDGSPTEELAALVSDVIDTKLVPDYREFRRQLRSERSGRLGRVLDVAGKIFQIDASPTTPKFYAELLKAFGMTLLVADAERKGGLTNKSQALQFMRTIEDHITD